MAAVHFNFNLHREVKRREKDGVERVKVSYPKFKNGEATVRDVRVESNFRKHWISRCELEIFVLKNLKKYYFYRVFCFYFRVR